MKIDEALVKIFHESNDTYVSGEEIAQSLEVSRTAVWNHIEKLKLIGYLFEAIPHLGYKLVGIPDKLLPDEIQFGLETETIGKKILSYESTASTNDVAYGLALDGAAEGTVIVAEVQEKGRGRMGREWISPSGKNILCSIVLRPSIEPAYIPVMTVMCAVGVALSIREVTGLPALIKWPNDVYIQKKKVSGILLEQKAELDRIDFIIAGIGINVNTQTADFSSELQQTATSLSIEKKMWIDRISLLQKVLFFIEKKYEMVQKGNYEDIINEWLSLSMTIGKRVVAQQKKGTIDGEAIGIEPNGSLLVRDDIGKIHNILSGDLKIKE